MNLPKESVRWVFGVSCLVVSCARIGNCIDCNGNDIEDATDLASGFSLDCNANKIPDECDGLPIKIGSRQQSFPLGRFPRAIEAVDLDGNGALDLVTGILRADGSSAVAVLAGRGAGEFSPITEFSIGAGFAALTTTDLDGDGSLELLVAQDSRLTVRPVAPDGNLGEPRTVQFSNEATFLVAGDVTGDGTSDVIVLHAKENAVTLLESDGDGGFLAPQSFVVGAQPSSAALGDLDGDGWAELVVSNAGSSNLTVLSSQDESLFAGHVDYEVTRGRPFSVIVEDLDVDGTPDVAAATPEGAALFLNDGLGGLLDPMFVQIDGRPNSLRAEDAEGDGDVDLILGHRDADKVTVISTGGTDPFRVGVLNLQEGNVPRSTALAAEDLDGDGDLDLATVFGPNLKILWNEGPERRTFPLDSHAYDAIGRPHGADVGDLDGDGDLDIVSANNTGGVISILRNRGDGSYDPPEAVRLFSFSVVAVDVDLDGDLDIVSVHPSHARVSVLLNDGDASFDLTVYQVVDRPSHVAAGDLDGNGYVDIVATFSFKVVVLWNRGDGTFDGPQTELRVGSGTRASALGDIDGDDDLDLATANSGSSDVALFANLGERQFAAVVRRPVPGRPAFVEATDIDGDGYVDLATANDPDRSVSVFWNRGRSGGQDAFENAFESAANFTINDRPFTLSCADLDADGRLELLTANQLDHSVSILFNVSGRTFEESVPFTVGNIGPRCVFGRDFDRDGDVDIVSANHLSEDFTVFLNQTFPGSSLERICTQADLVRISADASSSGSAMRATKYVLPARFDPSLLPTLFQNVNRFQLHEDFLATAFPDRFPSLPEDRDFYNALVGRRATRDYYVGVLFQHRVGTRLLHAFTIVADTGFAVSELLELEEVRYVHETLRASFELEPLAYQPATELEKRRAESWTNPPFDVFFGETPQIDFEAYTTGTGFGRVRLLSLEEFQTANEKGLFTFQDVLVIDEAPRDIEGVVGGVITGAIQGDLSHIAVRTARRGTPNAFVKNAREALAPRAGELVRLQVFDTEYFVEPATSEEAEAFWSQIRPSLAELPEVDAAYRQLDALDEMSLDESAVSRFGGKATNFARLQDVLGGTYASYRASGFAIPMHYYVDFMQAGKIAIGGEEKTYQEHLTDVLTQPGFESDSQLRFENLDAFRQLVRRQGVVDATLVQALIDRSREVFGSTATMVRYRSSSNVEDALEFNGAGLYESTSVCPDDTLDPASPDGSHCDPLRDDERTIERALKKVWTSLWTFRAHEERSWFQIPPERAAMGILVTRAFLDEVANGVAFTGNPRRASDKRYVVTAQIGEESVVSPAPGTLVERNLLEMADGTVVRIIRERSSSLVEPGETVLSDDQLRELGQLMAHVDREFPLDLAGHPRDQVLLDFEFKIEPDGALAVKQVRPFLIPESSVPTPQFELLIPTETLVCGMFPTGRPGRAPLVEYQTKSQVSLRSGSFDLPTGAESFSADLIESVVFGEEQLELSAEEPGLFELTRVPSGGSETIYRFSYTQTFRIPGGERFDVEIFDLAFRGRGEVALDPTIVFDEAYLMFDLVMEGAVGGEPLVTYSSCEQGLLPLWHLDVDLDGDSHIRLVERFLPSENLVLTGPASLQRAELILDGHNRVVSDYWQLVYAAQRHNLDARYWVVLEPPVSLPGLSAAVRIVEIATPNPAGFGGLDAPRVTYFDEMLSVVGEAIATGFDRQEVVGDVFRRGDVDGDGEVDLNDAVSLLGYLFRRGETPPCAKSADADDDGRLTVSDAVRLLLHLFASHGPLPEPTDCEMDPTVDTLTCEAFTTCASK